MIPETRLLEMQAELLIGIKQPINDDISSQSFLFTYSFYNKKLEEEANARRSRNAGKLKVGPKHGNASTG